MVWGGRFTARCEHSDLYVYLIMRHLYARWTMRQPTCAGFSISSPASSSRYLYYLVFSYPPTRSTYQLQSYTLCKRDIETTVFTEGLGGGLSSTAVLRDVAVRRTAPPSSPGAHPAPTSSAGDRPTPPSTAGGRPAPSSSAGGCPAPPSSAVVAGGRPALRPSAGGSPAPLSSAVVAVGRPASRSSVRDRTPFMNLLKAMNFVSLAVFHSEARHGLQYVWVQGNDNMGF